MDQLIFQPEPRLENGFSTSFDREDRNLAEHFAAENTSKDELFVFGLMEADSFPKIYRFPYCPFTEVVQIFGVGRNIMNPKLGELLTQLAVIEVHRALTPYLAVPKQLKLRIEKPIDEAMCELIDETLVHFACEPMLDEEANPISDNIAVSGKLHFWWD